MRFGKFICIQMPFLILVTSNIPSVQVQHINGRTLIVFQKHQSIHDLLSYIVVRLSVVSLCPFPHFQAHGINVYADYSCSSFCPIPKRLTVFFYWMPLILIGMMSKTDRSDFYNGA